MTTVPLELPPDDQPEALISSETEPFCVEIRATGRTTCIAPIGELDMATADELDGALRGVVDSGCHDLLLDLRGLKFLDSSGLHLILRWHALTQEEAINFAVVQGKPEIRRLFEIVGLLDALPFVTPAAEGRIVAG